MVRVESMADEELFRWREKFEEMVVRFSILKEGLVAEMEGFKKGIRIDMSDMTKKISKNREMAKQNVH